MIKSHKIWNKNNPHDKIEVERGCGTGQSKNLIHHKDENHDNDASENQEKMTRNKHTTLHKTGNKLSEEHKKKLLLANIGSKRSEKTKKNISKSLKGRILSLEHIENMSKALKGRKSWNKGKFSSEETKRKIKLSWEKRPRKFSKEIKLNMSIAAKKAWKIRKKNVNQKKS